MIEPACGRKWLRGLLIAATVLLPSVSAPGPAQEKAKQADLAPRYQDWLKLVTYIILLAGVQMEFVNPGAA